MTERQTAMMPFITRHLERLSDALGEIPHPIHAYVAGGAAVNHYLGGRMSNDVDIKWSHKIAIPPDLTVFAIDGDDPDAPRRIGIDAGFTDVLGSFPPDWENRAAQVATAGNIVVHVIDPVDLAVSKVARFQDRDIEDIRLLAKAGLVDPILFATRLQEALGFYVGKMAFVQWNARDATDIVRKAAPAPPRSRDGDDDTST